MADLYLLLFMLVEERLCMNRVMACEHEVLADNGPSHLELNFESMKGNIKKRMVYWVRCMVYAHVGVLHVSVCAVPYEPFV